MRDAKRSAATLFAAGATRAEVARRLGVARSTAGAWWRRLREEGEISTRRPGPPPRLGPAALERLAKVVLASPRAAGFPLDRWSLAAVVRWIEAETGVVYHPRHVGRVLARAGFVVAPVGAHAAHARLAREVRDPDGNRLLVLARPTAPSRPVTSSSSPR